MKNLSGMRSALPATILGSLLSCGSSSSLQPHQDSGQAADASRSGLGSDSGESGLDASDAKPPPGAGDESSDAGAGIQTVASSYLIDPSHTGAVEDPTLVPPLTRSWTQTFPGPVSYPLIAEQAVYVVAAPGVPGGGLSAFDAKTGQPKWGPVDVGEGLGPFHTYGAAAYDAGRVFALSGDGVLRALDATTGAGAWSVQLPIESDFQYPPTAYRGFVYAAGDGDGTIVYAVDESSGNIVWQRNINGSNAVAVSDDGAFVSSGCNEARAFDRLTGADLWWHGTLCTGPGSGAAALYHGLVFARDFPRAGFARDQKTGDPVFPFTSHPPPAFHGDLGFFVSGGGVHAASLTTRASAWTFAGDGAIATAPVVVGGAVYVGSTNGNLYGLDETSGALVWSDDVGMPFAQSSMWDVVDPAVALAAADGVLAAPVGSQLVVYRSSPSAEAGADAIAPDATPASDAAGSGGDGAPPDGGVNDAGIPSSSTTIASAYLINPAHTGAVDAPTLVPPLRRLWSVQFADTVSYPLIVNGVIYVIVGWGAPNAGLTAFDARTGVKRWGPLDTGEGTFIGGHAYDDGRIFVVNNRGFAQAFDAQSGLPLWANVITDQLDCTTPPTAYGGVVTFSGASEGATFYGVDEANGSFLWQAHVQGGEVSASAASSAGIFASYACAQAYGFAQSGTALWYSNSGCEGGGGATPALYGTQLYIRDASGNTVIDVTTGKVLGVGTFVAGPPIAFDGNLGFFISGDVLQAVDMTTSKTVWTFTGDSALVTAPVVAGGYVYVGSAGGDLYALTEATGAKAWADAVGSAFVGSPVPGNLDPYASLGAAEGVLVAPAGRTLVVYGK